MGSSVDRVQEMGGSRVVESLADVWFRRWEIQEMGCSGVGKLRR